MKLTLQTQLLPDRDRAQKLSATMQAFNAAADWLAGEAFRLKTANKVKLQQLYYRKLREDFGLSAQMTIRCIAQVCEAYSREKSKRPRFKKYASVPYDQRLMSFKGVDRVSLLTLEGRIIVPVIQLRAFIEYKAAIAGIPVVAVDPQYTSQMCSQCGHIEKANRKSQSEFQCRRCGFETHADHNGARNIRARALVNAPMVSEKRLAKAAKYRDKLYLQRASV